MSGLLNSKSLCLEVDYSLFFVFFFFLSFLFLTADKAVLLTFEGAKSKRFFLATMKETFTVIISEVELLFL